MAQMICKASGFEGKLVYDTAKAGCPQRVLSWILRAFIFLIVDPGQPWLINMGVSHSKVKGNASLWESPIFVHQAHEFRVNIGTGLLSPNVSFPR